jgi:two-component system, sensor histidine kinase and response regulator
MLPIECNETAHRQLEYSREEFARLRIADHEAAETPEETKEHVEKVVRERQGDCETRHRTEQGNIRDVLVTEREQPEAQYDVQDWFVLQPR